MRLTFYFPAICLLAGLGSCTVYTPLQPRVPLVRARGQGELSADLQPLRLRPEAAAAYSPISHLLLSAAGSWRPPVPFPNSAPFRALLGEAALGTYWRLGPHYTCSGQLGAGRGEVTRVVKEFFLLSKDRDIDYTASYITRFGQLGVLYYDNDDPAAATTISAGYRLTQLRFQALRAPRGDLPLEGQWRHEVFAQARQDLPHSRWQLEASLALAMAQLGRQRNITSPYEPIPYLTDLNRGSAWLLGVGVVYRLGSNAKAR